jgi:mannose-6-phosphate isomerase-like protein (cupin superfamily)
MKHIAIDDVTEEPHPMGVNSDRRVVSDALDADDVAVIRFDLAPGEQFSGGLHTHHDQEELFYILEGTATWDVGPEPDADHAERHASERPETEEVVVEAGEVIRFPPGQFQCGRNKSDGRVVGLAVAAPGTQHDWEALESFAPCAGDCDGITSHGVRQPDGDGMVVYCNECGAELQVA